MSASPAHPPPSVVEAFELEGAGVGIAGGSTGVIRFGDAAIAAEFVPDLTPLAPDWAMVIDAGARLHHLTADIEPPIGMLHARQHRWARGERHAFDEEPVVLTPEFRTHAYSAAVVIADAIVWSGAQLGLIDVVDTREVMHPQLARALRFRLVTDYLAAKVTGRPVPVDRYLPLISALSD